MGRTMQQDQVSWNEWAPKIIAQYNLKKTGANHYNGPCPQCIGTDRFYISEKSGAVRFNCNQGCEFKDLVQTMRDDGAWPEFNKDTAPLRPTVLNNNPFKHELPGKLYHEIKGVQLHGAEIVGDTIKIKIGRADKKPAGHQIIYPNSSKRFSKDIKVDGAFAVLGGLVEGVTYLCEGWATAASVTEATGRPAVFCLNAGNLPKVAEILKETKPNATLIVAADHDEPGIKAAKATGLPYKMPNAFKNDWNDVHKIKGLDAVKIGLETSLLSTIFTPENCDLVLKNNYLLKGWLGRGQMSVMYGPSNVGKSFVALDMAWSIASGTEWHGARCKGGPVLYLATEGGGTFKHRVYAIKTRRDDKDVPLYVRPSPVDLLRPDADLDELIQLCDEIKTQTGEDCAAIVVDTVSRAMAGGNENGPEDMTAFIANIDALRAATGAHCMLVHHSGKDLAAGARGHSSLRAATDTEIELEVSKEDDLRFARATKQRDMATGAEFAFTLKVVDLGLDEDMDMVTTCIIERAEGDVVADAKKKPITQNGKILIECFTQMQGEKIGKPNSGGDGWPDIGTRWVIETDKIREKFFGKINTENKRSTYLRAVESLKNAGHLAQNNDHFWLTAKKYKIKQV